TKYELIVREQPLQCRMSGFGEKDRRPIDPTPIVQLRIFNEERQINLAEHQCPLCVLQASLWSSDCTQQLDTVQVVQRKSSSKAQLNPLRTLTGTLTSSPSILRDLDNELGIYFAFPDVSVRVAQTYCLKFDLLLISDPSNSAEIVTHVYSDPFTVYSVKDFPGMNESSSLAKCLSKQGLKVSVRHSVRPKKPHSEND
ncbi:velvet factor, partial [Cunninghamella echinulata]